MLFCLTANPRVLFVASKSIQSGRRLITGGNQQRLLRSSGSLAAVRGISSKQASGNKFPRRKHVAFVSGFIIVGSYISFNNSNYYNLDTISTDGDKTRLLTNPPKGRLLNQDRYFSTSTSSMDQKTGVGRRQHKEGVYLLSDEQTSATLRKYEESYLVNRGKGVTRYDTCQVPSNSPIEDDRAEEIVLVPILQDNNVKVSTDWMFFGLYDGHGGWTTSGKLRDQLISSVVNEFGTIFKPANEENLRFVPNSATVDQAIKNGFLKLDHEIVNKNVEKLLTDNNKARAAELLMPALSGSCGLLSFYDTNSKMLKVAVTGDSRALLGSFKDNRWTVKQLSIDQTGSNPTEVARIISEHPGEPNVIRNGRVLGSLEPTRAFGDCRYKLPRSIQEKIYKVFFGRPLPPNLNSPPYVTAEPVVTTTKVNPKDHDFLVMASDGLFEMLSNEEVVGLVVRWMEKEKMVKPKKSFWNSFGSTDSKLPEVADITNDKTSKQPFRRSELNNNYLLDDKNVSTHLIRNALSNGGSKEHLSMLLSIPSPVSRKHRDDLSVTVVFFGNDGKGENDNGKLEFNAEATAGGIDVSRPKL